MIQQPGKQPPKIARCGDTPARREYPVLNVNASLICSWREKEEKLASTSLHSLTTAPSVDEDVLPPSHMRTHEHWLLIRQLHGRFQQQQLLTLWSHCHRQLLEQLSVASLSHTTVFLRLWFACDTWRNKICFDWLIDWFAVLLTALLYFTQINDSSYFMVSSLLLQYKPTRILALSRAALQQHTNFGKRVSAYTAPNVCPYAPSRALRSSASKRLQVPPTYLPPFVLRCFHVSAPTRWNSLPHSVRFRGPL